MKSLIFIIKEKLKMETVSQILLTVVPAIVTYFIGYKQNKVTTESTQLDNLEKSINVYNLIIKDMSIKIQELTEQVNKLELQIDVLMEENKHLKSLS